MVGYCVKFRNGEYFINKLEYGNKILILLLIIVMKIERDVVFYYIKLVKVWGRGKMVIFIFDSIYGGWIDINMIWKVI